MTRPAGWIVLGLGLLVLYVQPFVPWYSGQGTSVIAAVLAALIPAGVSVGLQLLVRALRKADPGPEGIEASRA
jgi:hypothetical protein